MKIPTRQECIHNPVCKYDDQMCAADCGYFELLSSTSWRDASKELPSDDREVIIFDGQRQIGYYNHDRKSWARYWCGNIAGVKVWAELNISEKPEFGR